ncbi:MAG: Gfo/Idh/MocA family oxidoreductase [Planctomycetes bacterium]|nr:Gfo/Idh/MocA family oxidoreductase [Planctomycetota bacterium]
MSRELTRRELLRRTALGGIGLCLPLPGVLGSIESTNERLNVACVGVGGRGRANLLTVAGAKENIVALCDVDEDRAGESLSMFPRARKFHDFRKMYDAMHKEIDAVVISTPDHTHAPASLMAMKLGKHCYCEKPLAHCVHEAREMARIAAESKVATQLGTQHHARNAPHRTVELIRSGAIGEVRECHTWIGGERGGGDRPTETPPVPEHLKWDLWLGPRPYRPYHPTYAPYGWRFWWDFGTGETGNNGVHILDIPFWALKLRHPLTIDAEGPPVHPETSPRRMHVRFEFAARDEMPPVTLHFYHAKDGPPILAEHKLPHWESGCLFVGAKGMLLSTYDNWKLFPEEEYADFRMPLPSIPDSIGHHLEWIHACKTGAPTTCNFDYGGALTELVLLGNVSYRAGRKLTWDSRKLEAAGCPEAAPFIKEEYRPGWSV